MTAEPATFELPEMMRAEGCSTLDAFIRASPAQTVRIDGQHVKTFSGLAAQLIAGHQKIRANGDHDLEIINPSEGLIDAMTQLGLAAALGNKSEAL
jgi:chemotaxis protein CheX